MFRYSYYINSVIIMDEKALTYCQSLNSVQHYILIHIRFLFLHKQTLYNHSASLNATKSPDFADTTVNYS